jgi:hypothetical protein
MSKNNGNVTEWQKVYMERWELNRPYAFKLFKKRMIALIDRGLSLASIKEHTSYFGIELEVLIVGNHGEYIEDFSYSFCDEAKLIYDNYKSLNF